MADDIRIKYGSTGFEKIVGELASLEKQGGGAANWFKPLQTSLKDAEESGTSFTSKFTSSISSMLPMVGNVVLKIAEIGAAIAAVAAVATGVGVAAFTSWTVSMLKTTESFKMLETSLYGATKSWETVGMVSKFAKEYAAEYPAMYKDVMQVMQSMAYMPQMKPMIERGDVEEMKSMMDVVQGLMTMRPEQGTQGAMFALREALSGNWRSLQMRFDVPIASIAQSAGMTMEQMKANPEAAVKALKAFTNEFVGAETMAMMAKNLSIQVGNLKDKYQMWMDTLGKTGVYDKVVGYIIKLNEVFDSMMKSERFKKITEEINSVLEDITERIAGIFTKGVNWESIATLGGLEDVLKKIGNNAIEEFKKVWEVAKDPLGKALTGVFSFVGSAAAGAFKDALLPAVRATIAEVKKISDEYSKEKPLEASATRVGIGSAVGGLIAGPKGLLLGPLLESLGGYTEIIGVVVKSGAEGISWLEKQTKDRLTKILAQIKEFSGQVQPGLGEEWKTVEEVKKMLTFPWIKNVGFRKALGLEPLSSEKGVEEFKKWMTEPPREWTGPWDTRMARGKAFVPTTAEQEFERYGMWSRMAGALAQAPMEAPKTASYLFATGAISLEELQKRRKVEEFQGLQMRKLEDITAMPEAGAELKTKLYEQMFTVSMGRGEFGKAESFMNKALESLIASLKGESESKKNQLQADQETAKNTGIMAGYLDEIRKQKAEGGKISLTNLSAGEQQAISDFGRTSKSSEDEIRKGVREGGSYINQ